MYKCSKCGLGVLVKDLPEPIRKCNCLVQVERKPSGWIEKLQSFFGIKFYIIKKAPITCDLDGHAYGRSQFSN